MDDPRLSEELKNGESVTTVPPEPERVLLHMPVDIRSISLGILAVLAVVFVLHWAQAVFIPVMLGLMFSYALSPLVNRMVGWHIPRAAAAGILLVFILATAGGIGWTLSDDTANLIDSLPKAAQKLRQALRPDNNKPDTAIEKVQNAATEIERAAQENGGASTTSRGVMRVQIEQSHFNIRDYLWTGTIGLLSLIGQIIVVCFIAFFLLASGDSFRRKLVKIAGPTFARRKITIQALDEITEQIQRYLLVQLGTSIVVGVISGIAYALIGLQHAAVWGVVAGVMNFVPYIGSIIVTVGTALVGFLQFGSIEMALATGGISLVIHTIEGNLVTPWLTSRTSSMNPVVIFIGVLAWGWLWGIWGLLLGIPIMMVIKAICDRVEDLKPIGELLGD